MRFLRKIALGQVRYEKVDKLLFMRSNFDIILHNLDFIINNDWLWLFLNHK